MQRIETLDGTSFHVPATADVSVMLKNKNRIRLPMGDRALVCGSPSL